MKKQLLLISISLVMDLFTQAQVTVKLGSIENAVPGTNVNVPLIVTGLSAQSFIGIELLFTFQESIISYDTLANGHPLTPVIQWISGSLPGKVSANWLEPNLQPINVDDNSTLIEFVFYYSGGQTDLVFDESAVFIYDMNANTIPIDQLISGTITQAQGSGSTLWNGTGPWTTPSNWSNGIPGDSTDAILISGDVELTSGGICRDLTISPGTSLIIQPGYSLTINRDFINNGEIRINSDSLIQGSLIVKGFITNNGVSEMDRQVVNGIAYELSSPVQGATAQMFSGLGTASVYNESTNNWSAMGPSTALDPGIGYAFESTANSMLHFTGPFNSTSQSINLPFTGQGNIFNEGWSLVGNPFTSSINSDNFMSGTNVDRAIYVWDGNRYLVWNGVSGSVPGGIIPPMTGFFIKANAANAQLTFESEGKIHDFSHFGNSYSSPSNVLPVSIFNFDDPSLKDEAYLQIEPSSTSGYDGSYDAIKLRNSSSYPEIFFEGPDDSRFAIAAIPAAMEADAGIRVPVDGTYVISAETFNFLPDHPVYLIDQESEITKDLRIEDYVFITTAGDHPGKFKIVMTGLGTDEMPVNEEMVMYSNDGIIMINSLKQLGKSRIYVYDLSGRLVTQAEEILETGGLYSVSGVAGLNIVRVETVSDIFSFKVFIR